MKKFGKFLAGAAAVAAAAAAVIYYFEKKKESTIEEDEFDDFEDFEDDLDEDLDEENVSREYVSLHKTEEVPVNEEPSEAAVEEEIPQAEA